MEENDLHYSNNQASPSTNMGRLIETEEAAEQQATYRAMTYKGNYYEKRFVVMSLHSSYYLRMI